MSGKGGATRICRAVGLVLLLVGSAWGSPVQHGLHRRQHVTQAMRAQGRGPRRCGGPTAELHLIHQRMVGTRRALSWIYFGVVYKKWSVGVFVLRSFQRPDGERADDPDTTIPRAKLDDKNWRLMQMRLAGTDGSTTATVLKLSSTKGIVTVP